MAAKIESNWTISKDAEMLELGLKLYKGKNDIIYNGGNEYA